MVKDDIGFLDLAEISERAAKYKFNILNVKRLSSLKTEATRSPDGTKVGCIEVVLSGQEDHDFDALRLSLMEMQHETGRLVGTTMYINQTRQELISDYIRLYQTILSVQTVEDPIHRKRIKTQTRTNARQRQHYLTFRHLLCDLIRPGSTGAGTPDRLRPGAAEGGTAPPQQALGGDGHGLHPDPGTW